MPLPTKSQQILQANKSSKLKRTLLTSAALGAVMLGGHDYAGAACSPAPDPVGDDMIVCSGTSAVGLIPMENGNDSISNTGLLTTSSDDAIRSLDGNFTVDNSGTMNFTPAAAGDLIRFVSNTSGDSFTSNNSGQINALTSSSNIYILTGTDSDYSINNTGVIDASAGNFSIIINDRGNGNTTINNTLGATITAGSTTTAILTLDVSDSVQNAGEITGGVDLGNLNDTLTNTATGTITGYINMGTGDDSVSNSGSVNGNIDLGIGDDSINNAGVINGNIATNNSGGGIAASDNDTVVNSGVINTSGTSHIVSISDNGTGSTNVTNSGLMDNTGTGGGVVHNTSGSIDISVNNSGTISVAGSGAGAIQDNGQGNVTVNNSGTIDAFRSILMVSTGDDSVINSGSINGTNLLGAGNDTVTNTASGTITGNVEMDDGDDSVNNAGIINGRVDVGSGDDVLENDGTINNADANSVTDQGGNLTINNDGSINTTYTSAAFASDVILLQSNDVVVTNNGTISSSGLTTVTSANIDSHGNSNTLSVTGSITLNNTGIVEARSSSNNAAVAVRLSSPGGTSISNTGEILSDYVAISTHLVGNAGSDTIFNTGTVEGLVFTGEGNDTITNSGSITGSIIVGEGDDTLTSTGSSASISGDILLGAGDDVATIDGGVFSGTFEGGLGDDTLFLNDDLVAIGSSEFHGDNGSGDEGEDALTIQSNAAITMALDDATGRYREWETITNQGSGDVTYTGISTSVTTLDIQAPNATIANGASLNGATLTDSVGVDNIITVQGTIGNINAAAGDDEVILDLVNGGSISGTLSGGTDSTGGANDQDTLTIQASSNATVDTDDYTEFGILNLDATGNDIDFTVDGSDPNFHTANLSNDANMVVPGTANLTLDVNGDTSGNNVTVSSGGQLTGNVSLGDGGDNIILDGTITGNVDLGNGDDSMVIDLDNGASLSGSNDGGSGTDSLTVNSSTPATINSVGTNYEDVTLQGDSTFTLSSGTSETILGNLNLNNATNLTVDGTSSLSLTGTVIGGSGVNDVSVTGTLDGAVDLGAGDDSFTVSGPGVVDFGDTIDGGAGVDTFVLDGVTTPTTIGAGEVINFEDVDILNGTVATFTGNQTFSNSIDVDGTSTLNVDNITTGTLTNAGTLASASGNGITITGDLSNSGTLEIIIDSDHASSTGTNGVVSGVSVSGTATLDAGSVINVSNLTGSDINNFTLGENYDVLTAGTLVDNGAVFNAPALPGGPLGLMWASNVSGTTYSLVLNATTADCSNPNLDANNLAVCGVLNGPPPGLPTPVLTAVLNAIGNGNPGDVMNKINPEGYLAMAQALQDADSNFSGTLRERLGELRVMRPFPTHDRDCGIFARGFGNFAEIEGDDEGHHGHSSDNFGGSIGGDCKVDHGITVGAAVGYSKGSLDHDLDFDGSQEVYHGALYATYGEPEFHIDGIVSYGLSESEATRDATIGTIGGTAASSYDSQVIGARLEMGTGIMVGTGTEIEPWVGLHYQRVMADELQETGAGDLSLAVDNHDTDNLTARVGLNARTDIISHNSKVHFIPEIRAHYQRELIGQDNAVDFSFGGETLEANGVEKPKDKAVVGIGFSTHINDTFDDMNTHNLYGHYDYEVGIDQDANNHKFSVGYKFKF